MQHSKWTCPKCGYDEFDTGEFRAVGGLVTKILDIQNKRFATVTCTRCQFTEIYRADSGKLSNLMDFIT